MLKITNNVPPIRHRKVQNEQTEISLLLREALWLLYITEAVR